MTSEDHFSRIDRWKTVLVLTAVMATLGAVWFSNQPAPTTESTWADVLAEAERGGYRLIDTENLRKLYEEEPRTVLLVDTRQEWEYVTGHIPESVNFSMEPTWWSRLRNRGPLETLLGADKERPIVFY
ncbi:MAG: rhodanese-like domain-containing protein [Desulfomonilaceae bacterium]|nr:rhodanese-like domain-containing protein [Desulfomonilaceae bacterium]